MAAKYHHSDMVEFFLSTHEGVDLYVYGLVGACEGCHLDLVRFFINKGAHPNAGMEMAAEKGHKHVIEKLVEWGANQWNWALKGAAKGGHLELLKFIIKQQTFSNTDFASAAEEASTRGHKHILEFLLSEEPPNINHLDNSLTLASLEGHMDVVQLLIDNGARAIDAGMCAAASKGHLDLVKFFVSQGADDWSYGLTLSMQSGHRSVVEFFWNQVGYEMGQADINEKLIHAVENGHKDIIDFFHSKGADPTVGLLDALQYNHKSVGIFLQLGANVDKVLAKLKGQASEKRAVEIISKYVKANTK